MGTAGVNYPRAGRQPVTYPPNSQMNQALRSALRNVSGTRGAKLARIFANPEQVEKDEHGNIVINPREDALARAAREAREARAEAEAAKRR